jgi:hypothetical protein
VSNAGVRVKWVDTDHKALYRFGYKGKYDLEYFGPGPRSCGPFTITGDRLTFAVEPSGPTGEEATATPAAPTAVWTGGLLLGPHSGVMVPPAEELDLTGDYTIEVWVRPAGITTAHQAILSRALDGLDIDAGGIQVHQLLVRIDPQGAVGVLMCNAEMTQSVNIMGGRVEANAWAHVAVTVDSNRVSLYVNGLVAASAQFQNTRLESLGAPLTVGKFLGQDPFSGHIHDLRIYGIALSADMIVQDAKSYADPSSADGLLLRVFAESGVTNTGLLGAGAAPEISEATWEAGVEPAVSGPSNAPWGFKVRGYSIPFAGQKTVEGRDGWVGIMCIDGDRVDCG